MNQVLLHYVTNKPLIFSSEGYTEGEVMLLN
jgi:hypothetical protein